MELDQKVRYGVLAFTVASAVLVTLGLHSGLLMRALEMGGRTN